MELEPLPQEPQATEPGGSRGSLPAGAAPLPPSDADLITASRSGDAAAYDTLYRRHAPAARTLARQLVRGQAEADDVVAETFAKILDLLRRGGGPEGAFRPYLLTAVRRAAYDRHRAERRQIVTDQMEHRTGLVPRRAGTRRRADRSRPHPVRSLGSSTHCIQ